MPEAAEKKSLWTKFRHKYRLSIYRDETYEEVLNLRLTRLNVLALLGAGIFLFLLLVISIIAYTPVRELIPGYPSQETVRNIRLNNLRLDSLELEIAKRDAYFENIRRIVAGEKPHDFNPGKDTTVTTERVAYSPSREDSVLRQQVEPRDPFSLSSIERGSNSPGLASILFFPPVKGMVSAPYNSGDDHYGVDIVAGSNEVVKATLSGTVTMAGWTLETGWVIQVQHNHNLLSVYKHNAELLKHIGDRVKTGEPIAIIGNSGEMTTGPHLHFELWYNGSPLNPQDYILF